MCLILTMAPRFQPTATSKRHACSGAHAIAPRPCATHMSPSLSLSALRSRNLDEGYSPDWSCSEGGKTPWNREEGGSPQRASVKLAGCKGLPWCTSRKLLPCAPPDPSPRHTTRQDPR